MGSYTGGPVAESRLTCPGEPEGIETNVTSDGRGVGIGEGWIRLQSTKSFEKTRSGGGPSDGPRYLQYCCVRVTSPGPNGARYYGSRG